jgi:hypothetical protein
MGNRGVEKSKWNRGTKFMNQYQYSQPYRKKSNSGCGRVAVIGGGCVVVLLLGFVGILVTGGLLWDRGTEAGGNFVSNWVSEQIGTDISARADAVAHVSADLPDARVFHEREEYLAFLDSYNREFARSMERVANLVSSPQLQNDEWANEVATEIALIRHIENEARHATPPEELSPAHEHWVSGMEDYRRAIDTAASALDNASISELGEGIGALSSATQSYIQMARELEDLGVIEDLHTIEELKDAHPEQ